MVVLNYVIFVVMRFALSYENHALVLLSVKNFGGNRVVKTDVNASSTCHLYSEEKVQKTYGILVSVCLTTF